MYILKKVYTFMYVFYLFEAQNVVQNWALIFQQ
jgi:hypothetical protein